LKEARLQNPVLTNRNGIRRPVREGKQAHLCEAHDQQSLRGRCRRNRMKEYVLTWGGLKLYVIQIEKSAKVIVVDRKRAPINRGGLTELMKACPGQ
jgi:hypothetical protein